MNIAFVNSSNSWGGLEMNICRLVVWLQAVTTEAWLFCIEDSPIHVAAKKQNIKTELIQRHHKYFDIGKSYQLYKLIKKHNIDAVFICDNRELSLTAITKRLTGNSFKLFFLQQMLVATSKKDIFHQLHHAAIDKWIAPLEVLKKQVLKYTTIPEAKITVIPLCVDVKSLTDNALSPTEAKRRLHLNPEPTLLGIVGRIDKLKGQHFVIEAIHKLRSEGANVELLISGEPTKEPAGDAYYLYIQQLVRELNMQSHVHFRPFQANLGALYPAIDIFVLPSQNETFGMVTIEAMLFARPIIATNAGGTPEILANGELGLLYENEDMTGFVDCVRKFLNDTELRQQIGKKASLQAAAKYAHSAAVEKIKELL